MVKIAVSTTTPGGLDALVDHRFGRCDYFTIANIENDKIRSITVLKNPAVNRAREAGILVAQTLASQGCNIVVTGKLNPNIYRALTTLNIKPYLAQIGETVKEALEHYIKGQLNPFTPPANFNKPKIPPPRRMISRRRGIPRLH